MSELLLAPKILALLSMAMSEMSTLLFSPSVRSRPLNSIPTTTDAFGC